jgi:hypothetical protein
MLLRFTSAHLRCTNVFKMFSGVYWLFVAGTHLVISLNVAFIVRNVIDP